MIISGIERNFKNRGKNILSIYNVRKGLPETELNKITAGSSGLYNNTNKQ